MRWTFNNFKNSNDFILFLNYVFSAVYLFCVGSLAGISLDEVLTSAAFVQITTTKHCSVMATLGNSSRTN